MIFILFLCCASTLHAADVLERSISVRFEQLTLKAALAEIAKLGGFEWSYNAKILDENRRVSLVAEGWTVRETLVYLLGDGYSFKQNGSYLILKKQKKPQQRLSGYVSDRRTGQKMAGVTVYDRQSLRSTTTNENGYYELPISDRSEIVVSKLAYRDTLLEVHSQTPRLVKLELYADSLPHNTTPDLREELNRMSVRLEQFFVSSAQKLSELNIQDSLQRRFQVSILPVLGTNHRLSGSVTNDWSLNILAGYSRGNRIVELGGLGNINRENTRGFQAAGLFNITGQRVQGMQAAGLFNLTGQEVKGVQAAGVFNHLGGNIRGVQVAGYYNFTGDTLRGAQFSGGVNIAGFGRPGTVQVAGAFNFLRQGQVSAQFSGAANYARRVNGLQAAGFVNTVDTLHGCQISGGINLAHYSKGVQIGLVNFANEIDGAQIGLINLSKRGGYVVLELSANDVLYANAAFKSGVPGFYTILTAGIDPESPPDKRLWAYGGGLGTRLSLKNWGGINLDLTDRHLSIGNHDNAWQEWAQFALVLDVQLGRHLSIVAGPSANLYIADPAHLDGAGIRARVVGHDWLNASNNAGGWLSAWLGWTVGLRGRF